MKLLNQPAADTTKLLLIGDSGTGKTGALASLAMAGYNLRIADMDNGVSIIRNILLHGKKVPEGESAEAVAKAMEVESENTASKEARMAALDRVDFVTITDHFKNSGGRLLPTTASAWPRLLKTMDDFPGFGPVSSWTPQDIFVLDSATFAARAAMRYNLQMNARLGQRPYPADWGEAQDLVEGLFEMLYDSSVKCNVVVISHISFIGSGKDDQKQEINPRGYASTIGRALSPRVGRYFNTVLQVKSQVQGPIVKRRIHTEPIENVELKNEAPNKLKRSYPLATGLASIFADLRSDQPVSSTKGT